MTKHQGSDEGPASDHEVSARENAVANRETWVRAREKATGEQQSAINDREEVLRLREDALRARSEVEQARVEREHLLVQMREANERLVLATLRADELVERATAAHALATESEGQAQASNRAKDEFLAMLSHELRNPLASILTALDLIGMDRSGAHDREHAVIARQSKHLLRLIDDLLDVSRITSHKLVLQREPVELGQVVSRAIETVSPLIESKHQVLHVEVAQRGLVVNGDAVRLVQVVGNLLTNAAKYTPVNGSIAVVGERRGATVALRVRDTGIGISNEMLPRVFDLFAQERQTLAYSPGGLGLGLAIVRSVVAMHGGTVTAQSDGKDRGSEFVVVLPAIAPGDVAAPEGLHAIAGVHAHKILVVDGNRDAAELTADALALLGHEVRVAFDGPSALALAERFLPDVLVLDIGLPGIDGCEVARRLRAALPTQHIGLIALTGYGQAILHQRSQDVRFDSHLVKPVDIATLQQSIEEVFASRSAVSGA